MSIFLDQISNLVTRLKRRWKLERNLELMQARGEEFGKSMPPSQGAPVVIFNASTRIEGLSLNAAFAMLTSWALRLQGIPVVHVVCMRGMGHCVLGTQRNDPRQPLPCESCLRESRALYRGATISWLGYTPDIDLELTLAHLTLDDLSAFSWQGIPLGELTLPSLRWVLRRHHLNDDDPTRYLLREFILSAWNIYRRFSQILDTLHPRAVVIFNGQFFPEASARCAAQLRKLRVISHEVAMQPFSAFFTEGEATAYPINIPKDFQLNAEQDVRLDLYLEQRFQGNFSMAGIRFWPEMKPLGESFWARASQFSQIVPVFTNVVFDTSQRHANTIFTDMFEWLDSVREIIQSHPETFFVIRAHPDEGRKGKRIT